MTESTDPVEPTEQPAAPFESTEKCGTCGHEFLHHERMDLSTFGDPTMTQWPCMHVDRRTGTMGVCACKNFVPVQSSEENPVPQGTPEHIVNLGQSGVFLNLWAGGHVTWTKSR